MPADDRLRADAHALAQHDAAVQDRARPDEAARAQADRAQRAEVVGWHEQGVRAEMDVVADLQRSERDELLRARRSAECRRGGGSLGHRRFPFRIGPGPPSPGRVNVRFLQETRCRGLVEADEVASA
jgi:hypothetical protein